MSDTILLPELHPGDPVQSVGIRLEVVRQTEKALLVQIFLHTELPAVWLPKSRASIAWKNPDTSSLVKMPAWLYRKIRPQLLGESK